MPQYFIKTILLFSLSIVSQVLWAQLPYWRNYTVDNGLPGNVAYDVIEDKRGYLWFVTDQGICYFNGYEFIQPADTSVLRGTEAFVPTEDESGKIWFARLDGSVWFVENDTVRAWKHNAAIIKNFRFFPRPLSDLAVEKDGTVWLVPLSNLGFGVIKKDGSSHTIKGSGKYDFLFAEAAGKLLYITSHDPMAKLPQTSSATALPMGIAQWENGKIIRHGKIPFNKTTFLMGRGIWKLRNGDFIFHNDGIFYLIHNKRIIWQTAAMMNAEKILETPDGGLLIASHHGKQAGLFHFASVDHLKRGEYRNLLPHHFVTDVCIDREDGWWVTTHHAGVFYCKNPKLEIFDARSGLASDEVACVANDGKATIFAGLRPAGIVAIDADSRKLTSLPAPPVFSRDIQALCFDRTNRRLWCSERLCFLENNQWHYAHQADLPPGMASTIPAKEITPDPSGNVLWGSLSEGFYRLDAKNGRAERMGTLPGGVRPRTFSVTPDHRGNVWVTTAIGLRLWQKDRYQLPPFQHPALRFQPRDVEMLPDDGMVISLRGAGLLFVDKKGGFTHFTRQNGLSSDFITRLYVSPEGVVFACSNTGLNRLTSRNGGGWEIETISAKKGLPSNEINDVTTVAGETWVATNHGLARFRELPQPYPMPAPILERLLINNKKAFFTPGLRLKYDEDNLSIRFFALHYRSEGNIPYRYRLSGADTNFVYSGNREVNFANLASGHYTFEVQAQNEAGNWSAPTRWNFEIREAWWQTTWFWVGLLALLFAGLGLWYRNHLRMAQHETEIQHRMERLESAALRAQMNPHFIFNCLNSIQHFISENDAAAATRYLSRFARLVRLALHGSVDGRHSLREEMDMLEHYLALEQLRFRGKFTYHIHAAPELDPDDLFLPPMLVQPFVENALLHGMKNREKNGQVSVAFAQQKNLLLVTVTDNGPGWSSEELPASEAGHKSVGVMLTQRRLDVLAGHFKEGALLRESIVAPDGTSQGMRVVIRVPIAE